MKVELYNIEFLGKKHECRNFTRKLTWQESNSSSELIYVGIKTDPK